MSVSDAVYEQALARVEAWQAACSDWRDTAGRLAAVLKDTNALLDSMQAFDGFSSSFYRRAAEVQKQINVAALEEQP